VLPQKWRENEKAGQYFEEHKINKVLVQEWTVNGFYLDVDD
jgi:hypothetical protein